MSKGLKIITAIVIILTLMAIASVTYAWLSWSKDISLTSSSKCFDIAFSKGADITGDLVPVDTPISDGYFTYKGGMALSTFTIKMNNSCATPGDFTLTLKSTNVPSSYINGDSAGALKYALVYAPSVTIDSSYYVFAQGSINTTDDITIYTGGITNDYNRTYTLIVYVDGNLVFDDAIGSSYSGSVQVDAVQKTSYDISGSLLDSSDNILTGYTITIDNEITSTTDASGNYSLSNVPLGEHSFIVKDSSNNVITNSTFTLEHSNNNSSNSSTIFIGSNRMQTLNIKLGSDNSIESYEWSRFNNSSLPIEYQEVEYLESSGTQYIQTGVYLTTATDFELTVMTTGFNSWQRLWGLAKNAGNTKYQIEASASTSYNVGNNGTSYASLLIPLNTKFTITKSGLVYSVIINDATTSSLTATNGEYINSNYNIYLLAGYDKISTTAKAKIYSATFYQNNQTVGNYIPAIRTLDSKPGMYDTVTNTFFTNSGTGEFGYGTEFGDYVAPQ